MKLNTFKPILLKSEASLEASSNIPWYCFLPQNIHNIHVMLKFIRVSQDKGFTIMK